MSASRSSDGQSLKTVIVAGKVLGLTVDEIVTFARLFGALDLTAALESLRRRGESDSKLAYSLKALLNDPSLPLEEAIPLYQEMADRFLKEGYMLGAFRQYEYLLIKPWVSNWGRKHGSLCFGVYDYENLFIADH